MTNSDINRAYLNYRNMHNEKGNIDNLSPLMHYFLMDCSYQVYCSEISNLPLKQLAAKHRNRVKKGFHNFFASVHLAFNAEQLDFLLDKVDSFQAFIHNSIEMCKIAAMDCFDGGSFEERLLTSNIWLVNALAADAAGYMEAVYMTSRGNSQRDINIDSVIAGSKALAQTYCDCGGNVEEDKVKMLRNAVKSLAKRICDWVYNDYNENKKYD